MSYCQVLIDFFSQPHIFSRLDTFSTEEGGGSYKDMVVTFHKNNHHMSVECKETGFLWGSEVYVRKNGVLISKGSFNNKHVLTGSDNNYLLTDKNQKSSVKIPVPP